MSTIDASGPAADRSRIAAFISAGSDANQGRKPQSPGWMPRSLPQLGENLLLFGFITITAALVLALMARATLRLWGTYNEGWNAFHAQAAFDGLPFYHAPDAYITNNYPPLSFLLTALVMHVVPDAVFAGRILSGAAFVAILLLIVGTIHRADRDWRAALFGATVYGSLMAINMPDYIAMDDPQMLGHAIVLGGLYALVAINPAVISGIVAALVIVFGLFVKHNLVALPIAAAMTLLLIDRRRFVAFAVTGLVAAVLGLLVFRWAFGHDFMTSMLSPRQYSLVKSWKAVLALPDPLKILICIASLTALFGGRSLLGRFLPVYLATSVFIGIITSTGEGVGTNAFYEVAIAVALAVGHMVATADLPEAAGLPHLRLWLVAVSMLAVVFGQGISTAKDVLNFPRWWAAQHAAEAELGRTIAVVTAHPGPALCQSPIVCYWAHRGFDLDTFNFMQAVAAGHTSDRLMVDRLQAKYYRVVVVDNPTGEDKWTLPIQQALHENYAVGVTTPHQLVYLPRTGNE